MLERIVELRINTIDGEELCPHLVGVMLQAQNGSLKLLDICGSSAATMAGSTSLVDPGLVYTSRPSVSLNV